MQEVNKIKDFVHGLINICPDISTVSSASGKTDLTHLSVYESNTGLPLGIEYNHKGFINVWVRQNDVELNRLDNISFEEKIWQPLPNPSTGDSPWQSPDDGKGERKGANSNLDSTAWPAFRKHDLYRFKVGKAPEIIRIVGEVLRT